MGFPFDSWDDDRDDEMFLREEVSHLQNEIVRLKEKINSLIDQLEDQQAMPDAIPERE